MGRGDDLFEKLRVMTERRDYFAGQFERVKAENKELGRKLVVLTQLLGIAQQEMKNAQEKLEEP